MTEKTIENKRKTIVFTGGGTGGHVFPNKPLIDHYLPEYRIVYIGSRGGMEEGIVANWGVEYIPILAGKLRRYMSLQNLIDIGKVFLSVFQCIYILDKEKPRFVYSKGGFVSVPVCIAARLLSIPVFIHEADMTPGLANKIASIFATHVFLTFPPLKAPPYSYSVSGLPLRSEIYSATAQKGKEFLGLSNSSKPILLVTGGSLGATSINRLLLRNLEKLTETFTVVHITGVGKSDAGLTHTDYQQYEFLGAEIYDVIAASDVVLSRAGSNSLIELMTLKKPSLLIPLTLSQSRGDQIQNAKYFGDLQACEVLHEEMLTDELLVKSLQALYQNREKYKTAIQALNMPRAEQVIIETIDTYIQK
jgi:UDP-N-acetylglucosamine--N-acetylmuramyl-(pentapeptide) pyrophosphoryl-undecaprenol N-acetylglucosamine transferase